MVYTNFSFGVLRSNDKFIARRWQIDEGRWSLFLRFQPPPTPPSISIVCQAFECGYKGGELLFTTVCSALFRRHSEGAWASIQNLLEARKMLHCELNYPRMQNQSLPFTSTTIIVSRSWSQGEVRWGCCFKAFDSRLFQKQKIHLNRGGFQHSTQSKFN